MKKKILISGYYGFRNSGDDALLLAISRDLQKVCPDFSLTVLSASPDATAKEYGVRAVNRMNPFSLLSELMRCDLLLSGGGTLIQDRTSTKSLLYYLAVIRLALLFGKKVMLYSNGIGPLKEEHRAVTRRVLNRVSLITLRDPASMEELSRIGVDKPEIRLTADPAFSLMPSEKEKADELFRAAGLSPDKKTICISVRPWKELPNDFHDTLAAAADELCRRESAQCVWIPMQADVDTAPCRAACEKMSEKGGVLPPCGIRDMLAAVEKCSLCIGMRLHSLIYAVSRGVPAIGLVYDPKISGVMDYMGKKERFDVRTVTKEELCRAAEHLLSEKDEYDGQQLAALRKKAEENAVLAAELLAENRKNGGKKA